MQQQQLDRPQMGLIQRSIVYPGTMFVIVRGMVEYMKQHGFQSHVRVELVDRLLEQLTWAEQNRQEQVAFLVFWWLYTTWDDYVEMTHDIERIASPLSSMPSELASVRLFALNHMKLFRSSPFMPCNVNQLIKKLQDVFLLGAHHRVPAVMLSTPLDPTRVDKEEHTPPLLLLPSQADQEFTTHMRRVVGQYVSQTNWRGVDDFSSGHTVVIPIPAVDESGADLIV
jgi:hypothetical protein